MNILFLSPQPYFEDRGTPIDVDLAFRVLSARGEKIDVVTYHLGRDVHYEGLVIHRIPKIPFIKTVSPGFSIRKVVCDFFMLWKALSLAGKKRYQIVHAVEEAVFIALILKLLFKIPYVYDMDSSLSQQMIERYPRLLSPFARILDFFEGLAVRNAKAVAPVCDALSVDIARYGPERVDVVRDISLLTPVEENEIKDDLRAQLGITGTLVMYVGNLATYQGVDLLMESFALLVQTTDQVDLVIIGGGEDKIQKYQAICRRLGIQEKVHFCGIRPVQRLAEYLQQADILVSPRITGKNTPMKIYSYLHSGKPLVATNLLTHTQVLNNTVAVLAEPEPEAFAAGMLRLVEDKSLRQRLGTAAQELVAKRHTFPVLQESYNGLYDWLKVELA